MLPCGWAGACGRAFSLGHPLPPGLDSRAAAVVMRTIRRVASTGRTIICTVHQPSYELFAQFDDLLLLQVRLGGKG